VLDFKELKGDGTSLEQLTREIFILKGLLPNWTGVGPDSGRDLLVEEHLAGSIQNTKKLWLVDCKDNSVSGRVVSNDKVSDIRDRCERVCALGFLLVCTTTVSSELKKKLDELNDTGQLTTEVWDSAKLERLLLNPHAFYLAQQFFPKSADATKWRMYFTEREERWMAHYAGNFLYVESRSGIDPPRLTDLERLIERVGSVEIGEGEELRIRAIWHDTPSETSYSVSAHYLVPVVDLPAKKPQEILEQLRRFDDDDFYNCLDVEWYVQLHLVITSSEYYSPDDPSYYDEYTRPLYLAFYRIGSLGELSEKFNSWINHKPPKIRTFVDQVAWEAEKEKFGYSEIGYTQKI